MNRARHRQLLENDAANCCPTASTATLQTMASHYAIINGVALLAISQHPVYSKRWSGPLIIAGTTLFSGSIFALLLWRER